VSDGSDKLTTVLRRRRRYFFDMRALWAALALIALPACEDCDRRRGRGCPGSVEALFNGSFPADEALTVTSPRRETFNELEVWLHGPSRPLQPSEIHVVIGGVELAPTSPGHYPLAPANAGATITITVSGVDWSGGASGIPDRPFGFVEAVDPTVECEECAPTFTYGA